MSWGKFLKKWQVRDKIIESIFIQFTFIFLWMPQTQKIIVGFPKFMNGYDRMCMSGRKFFKEWKVRDKIIESIFFQFTFNLFQMTQTQKILTPWVLKIHKWMLGDVYEYGNVS